MTRMFVIAMMLAAMAAPAFAGGKADTTPAKGERAEDIEDGGWIANRPSDFSIRNKVGEVIYIDHWGLKSKPSHALLTTLNGLYKQFNGKGFHVFSIEGMGCDRDAAEALVKPLNLLYPVGMQTCRGRYNSGGPVPWGWLIGVDGNVAWEGDSTKVDIPALIKDEMKKVKYLGLGRWKMDPAVDGPAKSWSAGLFGKAREEAAKVKDGKDAGEEAKKDADYIIAKCNAKADALKSRAEKAASEVNYLEAVEAYAEISKGFAGYPEAKEADKASKELKSRKEVKAELKAWDEYNALVKSIEKQAADQRKKALETFAKDKQGTKAGQAAAREADNVK